MKPTPPANFEPLSCTACRENKQLPFKLRMAFQPIYDLRSGEVYAYEALVRGPNGEGAKWVLEKISEDLLYHFDQVARVTAIETASRLAMSSRLSINFLPNAVYRPETCIRATLEAAEQFNFPHENLIFEVSETEQVISVDHLVGILQEYRSQGFLSAIDDFGSGYSGLKLLTYLRPDIVKLDRDLIAWIDQEVIKQKILLHTLALAQDLNIIPIAEGIEREEEKNWLFNHGIYLQQGYLFAKPTLETLAGNLKF